METFRDARFLIVCAVLLAAAVGLNLTVQAMRLHFRKEPVPMRRAFADALPPIIGDWVQVARDENLQPELLASLGTNKFLFCHYVNAADLSRSPRDVQRQLVDGKTLAEQQKALGSLAQRRPSSVVNLSLTYYTGSADTVPHIPERCYVAGGFDPRDPATARWDLGRDISVRYITFESEGGARVFNVAYFFNANGVYRSDSLEVRALLQDLSQRYSYFAKIELACETQDRAAAEKSMKEFLKVALPHIEQALPDWSQYRSRRN